MPDALAPTVRVALQALQYLAPLVLVWLAFFFGRTLRAGATPLIEQIARRGKPALPIALCRYTRLLTGIWCAYFIVAALAIVVVNASGALMFARFNLAVWAGTAVLFIGEHWLRPRLFPGEVFPGLLQQVRDTWSIWRPSRPDNGQ